MFEPTHTRRAMLRRTLAATAAGALLGTAGCAGLNPLSGGGGAYADWLPVPDDIGDSDHYQFAAVDTETLAANEAELGDGFTISPLEESWNPADIDWEIGMRRTQLSASTHEGRARSISTGRRPASRLVHTIDGIFQPLARTQSAGTTSSFGFSNLWARCVRHRSRSAGVKFEYVGILPYSRAASRSCVRSSRVR